MKKSKKEKKPREKIVVDVRKLTAAVLLFFVLLYAVQALMHYQQSRVNPKIKASTEYEEENDMPILETDRDIKNKYEREFLLSDALINMTGAKTTVKKPLDDSSVVYSLMARKDKDSNLQIQLTTDSPSDGKISSDIRILEDNISTLFIMKKEKNAENDFTGYVRSEYKTDSKVYSLDNVTVVYDFLKAIQQTDTKDYDVIYNCRTKLDGREVDDITISFKNANYSIRAFVDVKQHQMIRVISCLLSNNDYTDILYEDDSVVDFTSAETKGAMPYNKKELTRFPNGTLGCQVNDSEMGALLTVMTKACSYNDLSVIDLDAPYPAETESEVKQDGK